MMRLVAFLRGHCRLEITGVEPSRCLNRFLRCGVGFWDLATPDAYTLQCSVLTRTLPQRCRPPGAANARHAAWRGTALPTATAALSGGRCCW